MDREDLAPKFVFKGAVTVTDSNPVVEEVQPGVFKVYSIEVQPSPMVKVVVAGETATCLLESYPSTVPVDIYLFGRLVFEAATVTDVGTSKTVYVSQAFVPLPTSVVVYLDGSNAVAVDGKTGQVIKRSTDHAEVIQAAIDEYVYGRVFIRTASYEISSTITIPPGTNGLELVGEGFGTHLFLADSVDASMISIGANSTRVRIADLRMSGNSANNTVGHAIKLEDNLDQCTFERLFISDFPSRGISYAGTAGVGNIVIRRCVIRALDAGIYLNYPHSTTTIDNCTIGNAVSDGEPYMTDAAVHLMNAREICISNTSVFCARYGINLEYSKNVKLVNVFPHVNKEAGIRLYDTEHCVLVNVVAYANGQDTATTSAGILLGGTSRYNVIRCCQLLNALGWFSTPFLDDCQKYGVLEGGTSDYNVIEGNVVIGNQVKQIDYVGINTVVRHNIGYVTENSGTATITAGTTSVTVSHGLATTPSKVLVTPLSDPGAYWYVANITSTSFDIVLSAAPAADVQFAWYAEV